MVTVILFPHCELVQSKALNIKRLQRSFFQALNTFRSWLRLWDRFSNAWLLSSQVNINPQNWSAGVKTELQLLHILFMSVMVSNLSWKSHKKEILHKVNAIAADIYLCINPLNMEFQIISKECKNSAALDTKELFPKRSGVWLTQNLTFGRKLFIVWSISEATIQSAQIQNTLNNNRSLPAPSQLFKHTKIPQSFSQKRDSATKPWEVVAGWQTQKVTPTELQKHPQKGLWEQRVTGRLQRTRFHPDLTRRQQPQGKQRSQSSIYFQGKHSIWGGGYKCQMVKFQTTDEIM